MARFEISAPTPGYKGESVAGVMFSDGKAVVTSDTDQGLRALAYFRSAGYGILALDDTAVDDVLQRGNETPEQESARLDREIEQLRDKNHV